MQFLSADRVIGSIIPDGILGLAPTDDEYSYIKQLFI
jgi:hypothetical protein